MENKASPWKVEPRSGKKNRQMLQCCRAHASQDEGVDHGVARVLSEASVAEKHPAPERPKANEGFIVQSLGVIWACLESCSAVPAEESCWIHVLGWDPRTNRAC